MIDNDIKCCTISCDRTLDQEYWNSQYVNDTIGWDLGEVSPPIKRYIDKITNKNAAILIPGCGNTYEAEYLLEQGFTAITVIDIAQTLVKKLRNKFAGNKNITILLGDFFDHSGQYDFIIEQTFFCALPPKMRPRYVYQMHQLLAPKGKLVGLLFNREFESGPPFGGSWLEYELLFKGAFAVNLSVATNSVSTRTETELFIELKKNNNLVNLYNFTGITCSDCMKSVSYLIAKMEGAINVSMSTDFTEMLIVSSNEIGIGKLQSVIAYDQKYTINKISINHN